LEVAMRLCSPGFGQIARLSGSRPGAECLDDAQSGDTPYAIVLAGGDGNRLAPFVHEHLGCDRPKQFCSFDGGDTLLQRTVDRISGIVAEQRLRVSLCASHQELAREQLSGTGAQWLLQPRNAGTGLGLLLPLIDILIEEPRAIVVVVPADHGFARDDLLVPVLERAIAAAKRHPERIVLVGYEPDEAATDYGWLVPDGGTSAGELVRVGMFVEKPAAPVAKQLLASGALWSTMITVASGRALFELFESSLPLVVKMLLHHAELPHEERAPYLEKAYAGLPPVDFSSLLLTRARELFALALPQEVGWSDLGTPERMRRYLERVSDPDAQSGERPIARVSALARASDRAEDGAGRGAA
jgi:mannose-1-phosphate guanylyltransferase